jgi:glutathionylspermidine synthase
MRSGRRRFFPSFVAHNCRATLMADGSANAPEEQIDVKNGDKTVKESNPEYIRWAVLEQQVIGFLITSMSKEVMGQVSSYTTPQEVWNMLEQTYAVQSPARTVNTRIALAMTRKGNLSISEYVAKMKALADEMASARKPIDEEELVSYILAGLDEEYNPVVSALVAQKDCLSWGGILATPQF